MSLKLKKIDIIITVISIVLVVFLTAFVLSDSNVADDAKVYVYIDNVLQEDWIVPLNVDDKKTFKKADYNVLLDDLIVEIKNKKVRIAEEESPRNYCSRMGYIGMANFPLICAPNQTKVIILKPNSSGISLR